MYDKDVLAKQLNEGLKTLSYDERMALTLFYFEEMNEAEIAAVLEKPYVDVEVALCQARMKMRSFTSIFDDIDKIGKTGIDLMKKNKKERT